MINRPAIFFVGRIASANCWHICLSLYIYIYIHIYYHLCISVCFILFSPPQKLWCWMKFCILQFHVDAFLTLSNWHFVVHRCGLAPVHLTNIFKVCITGRFRVTIRLHRCKLRKCVNVWHEFPRIGNIPIKTKHAKPSELNAYSLWPCDAI